MHRFECWLETGEVQDQDLRERLLRNLELELADIDGVKTAPINAGGAPPGSKSITPETAGLIIAISGSGALLPVLVSAIRDWMVRQRPSNKLKFKDGDLEIEWEGSDRPAELEAFFKQMISRRRS